MSARCWSDSSVNLAGPSEGDPSLPGQGHLPNKSIPSGDTCDGIEHDFSALAAEEGSNESWLPVVSKTENWIAENGH